MKTKTKEIFFVSSFVLTLFLLFSAIVNAVDEINENVVINEVKEDFYAYSKNVFINLNQGSVFVNKIYIKNTGQLNSFYSIKQEGSGKKFSSLSVDSFSLDKGKEGVIYNYINIPFDSEDGVYVLKTEISTALGLKKVLVQEIKVERKNNIRLMIENKSIKIKPCKVAVFKLKLFNPANFLEIYNLKTESKELGKFITLSQKEAVLPENASMDVFLNVNPSCDVYGNYTIPLIIETRYNKLKAKIDLNLEIERDYDFDVRFGDYGGNKTSFKEHYGAYELCEFEKKKIPVKVMNKADVVNGYLIKLINKPKFVSLDYNKIENLAKNKSVLIYINLDPKDSLNKTYNLSFYIASSYGNIKKEADLSMRVSNCYTPELSRKGIKVNYSLTNTNIEIKNKGNKKAIYRISSNLPQWIKFPDEIEVNAFSSKNISITTIPSNNTKEGVYKGELVLTAENDVSYKFSFYVELYKKKINLKKILSISLACLLAILIIFMLFVTIKSKIPKRKREVEEVEKVKEEKKESKKLKFFVSFKKRWLKYFIILIAIIIIVCGFVFYKKLPFLGENVSLNETQLETGKSINITKAFINKTSVKEHIVSSFSFAKNKTLKSLTYAKPFFNYTKKLSVFVFRKGVIVLKFIGKHWLCFILAALGIVVIILLFLLKKRIKKWFRRRKRKKVEKRKKREIKKVIFAVLSVILVILVVAYGFKLFVPALSKNISKNISKEEVTSKGIPEQRFYNSDTLAINLSKYFYDPDNDILYYSYSKAKNLSISIEQDIAYIKADKGFYGSRNIVFMANDGKGGSARSNIVKIVVVKKPLVKKVKDSVKNFFASVFYSTKSFLITYSNYIIAGFVILLILAILIKFYKPILDFFEEKK